MLTTGTLESGWSVFPVGGAGCGGSRFEVLGRPFRGGALSSGRRRSSSRWQSAQAAVGDEPVRLRNRPALAFASGGEGER